MVVGYSALAESASEGSGLEVYAMKVVRLVFSIFAVVGLGLLAGGIYSVWHTRQFLRNAVSAPGVVVENIWREDRVSSTNQRTRGVSWAYYPRIHFQTASGQEIDFVSDTGASPPSYHVNQTVTVLYDPLQPYHASTSSFASLWVGSIVLLGMGVIFTSPGIGFIVWTRANNRKNAWLHQNGRRIQAEVKGVELNTSLSVNGANPYRIACQWLDPASNKMYLFHSGNIWYDPTDYVPKSVEVLVDPNNLHRYTVETPFLPKLA
jgi:hypothetical protein